MVTVVPLGVASFCFDVLRMRRKYLQAVDAVPIVDTVFNVNNF
jgi:hypothetical protein